MFTVRCLPVHPDYNKDLQIGLNPLGLPGQEKLFESKDLYPANKPLLDRVMRMVEISFKYIVCFFSYYLLSIPIHYCLEGLKKKDLVDWTRFSPFHSSLISLVAFTRKENFKKSFYAQMDRSKTNRNKVLGEWEKYLTEKSFLACSRESLGPSNENIRAWRINSVAAVKDTTDVFFF